MFLRERHEPIGITITVAAFFAANAMLAVPRGTGQAFPGWGTLLPGFMLVWLVFLHMRLFDEVKDYAFDREHNPTRPLARGLIGLGEFGTGTLLCILTEIILAAGLGWSVLSTYVFVLAFTLLMRMEFFIGDWMRPKLELYAITHTFSASFLGMLVFSIVTLSPMASADNAFLSMALGNWFVFNVFEFGRKTFAVEEEREGVDSYSARLYPWGAVLLLLANTAAGYGLLVNACYLRFGEAVPGLLIGTGIIALLVVISGVAYSMQASKPRAKAYRGTVTFYLLAYHLAIALGAFH